MSRSEYREVKGPLVGVSSLYRVGSRDRTQVVLGLASMHPFLRNHPTGLLRLLSVALLSKVCGCFQWQGLVVVTDAALKAKRVHSPALQRKGLPGLVEHLNVLTPKSPKDVELLHLLKTYFIYKFLFMSLGADNTCSGLNGEINIILFASLGISFLQEKEGN